MDDPVSKAAGREPQTGRKPKHQSRSSRGRPLNPGPKPSEITAITFDVGGTLIECWPSVGHIYAEVAAQHGFAIPPALLNQRFKAAWKSFRDFRHTRSQWAELVDQTFADLAQPPPSQTFFSRLYQRFSEPAAWHVYDDVLPTLQQLKARGLKLGVLSNWDDRLKPLLRRLRLDSYFDVIMVSCEEGLCKPAPELFARACAALDSPPEKTLHVGDHPQMDLRGARAAGLQALRVRRDAARAGSGEVRSLRELISYDYFYYVIS